MPGPLDGNGTLRPIERRMLKLVAAGAGEVEIAWRFRRTPKNVRQVIACANLPRGNASAPSPTGLRPIERRVLWWREQGADFDDLATRFRRRPESLEQIEHLARYKLAR